MTEDWQLKSKPHRTFSFPDLSVFFNLAPVFLILLSFLYLSSLLSLLFFFFPSLRFPVLNSIQLPCLATFVCMFTSGCVLQSSQSSAKDEMHRWEARIKLSSVICVFFCLLLMQLSHTNQSWITFTQCN